LLGKHGLSKTLDFVKLPDFLAVSPKLYWGGEDFRAVADVSFLPINCWVKKLKEWVSKDDLILFQIGDEEVHLLVGVSESNFESTFLCDVASLIVGSIDVMNRSGLVQFFDREAEFCNSSRIEEIFGSSTINESFFSLSRRRHNQLYFQSISFGNEHSTR
jgi:hypothetical protein